MVDIEGALESPGFWILAGGGVACELVGWLYSRRALDVSLPLWQLIIMMIVTVIAALFFAGQE